jgi:hypothetical protein
MQVLEFPTLESITLPPEGDESMAGPTNKKLLQDHEERLKQVEGELGLHPPKLGFWLRMREWIKENSWISLGLSVVLTCTTIFGGYWLNHYKEWWNGDVDRRVQLAMDKPGGIKQTLASIQATVDRTEATLITLEPFIHDVVVRQFESASKLPAKDLTQRLPALQHLVAVARDQRIAVDPVLVRLLTRNLLNATSALPSSWGLSNQMLSYYTSLNPPSDEDFQKAGYVVISGTDATKDCLTITPGASGWGMRKIVFEHCTQHFDSAVGPIIFVDSVFNDVRVIYGGGKATFRGVTFVNCVFELAPSQPSKVLAETLLASTRIKNLSLP